MRTFVVTIVLVLSCPVAEAAELIPLRAGPLTMVFDPDLAFLRYLKLGHDEVLRGINAPVRDQSWNTIQPKVSRVELDDQGDYFTLEFDVHCRERDIDFRWHGTIRGSAEGTVELVFEGVAGSTFLRNRIGFCVLHAPAAVGMPWVVEHTGGERSAGRFPIFIAPNQPVKDVRAITHDVTSGVRARVEFAGDVFEMEDQRNWTDASFKTYCTPLARPRPVRVTEGETINQRITIRLEGGADAVEGRAIGTDEQSRDDTVLLTLDGQKSPLVGIGLQISSEIAELSEVQLQRLRALNLDHLRVDLTPADSDFVGTIRRAASQASALNLPLHAELHLQEHSEEGLRRVTAEVNRAGLKGAGMPISVWLINDADQDLFQLARQQLKPHHARALIGVSQGSSFVDLNRDRPVDAQIEVVAHGVNPQIHAIDNASIIETLPIQGDTVRSARQFIDNRSLIVGPITLRPQPVHREPAAGKLPSSVDARQSSLFAAGWVLGSIQVLSEAGAQRATYFETVGWKGIMEAADIPPRPAEFSSRPGEVFAVYHVLRAVADFAGGEVTSVVSSDALSVVGLALSKDSRRRLLVANLTDKQQRVAIPGFGDGVDIWTIDAQSLADTRKAPGASLDPEAFYHRSADLARPQFPLVLPPHGIVRIDQ